MAKKPKVVQQDAIEKVRPIYEKLKEVRASKTVSLKPNPLLRDMIRGLDGEMQPLRFRYYQCQGIYHLLMMPRMVLGDGTGLGKTLEAIGAMCYMWPNHPEYKVMVVAPKSALRQWADEIRRFTVGVRPIIATGTLEERIAAYDDFVNAPIGPDAEKVVLLLNYHILVRDWNHGRFLPTLPNGKPDPKIPVKPGLLDEKVQSIASSMVVIFDEATAFKSLRTKTSEVCRFVSDRVTRVYGLTATLLKNNLIEGYAIYTVIRPDVFGVVKQRFLDDYCETKLQSVAGSGRKIPIITKYKNLEMFRAKIDPFFLGRPKHLVSDELPVLTTREVVCNMSTAEDAKYAEALKGVISLGDGEVREFEDHKALVSLTYCQQVVNSMTLLRFKGGDSFQASYSDDVEHKVKELGAKEQALHDLVVDELDGEKIIVYTRFESLVSRLQGILASSGVKSVRITGAEKEDARKKAQDAFQDLNADTRVVFITDAGSEAINLQAASATIFYDSPWSWGNYVQIIGRMIRIGSPHKGVLVYHIISERASGGKNRVTIDGHVIAMLRKKKGLIDKVLGEAAVGALDFGKDGETSIRDLVRRMRADAAV